MTERPASQTDQLARAIAHHQAGRLAEAEQLYRVILHTDPHHADAHHNLGLIAVQSGQTAAAVLNFKGKIALYSMHWRSCIVYGLIYNRLNI